jgi:hypothetical protein
VLRGRPPKSRTPGCSCDRTHRIIAGDDILGGVVWRAAAQVDGSLELPYPHLKRAGQDRVWLSTTELSGKKEGGKKPVFGPEIGCCA